MSHRSERGVVLVTALLMLTVLTTLTLAATRDTSMQQRMATYLEHRLRAFEAAETGLRAAERWLETRAGDPRGDPACARACAVWAVGAPWNGDVALRGHDAAWWTVHGRAAATGRARYVIEELQRVGSGRGRPGERIYYRVTARGTNVADDAAVLLQSTVARYRDDGHLRVERRAWRRVPAR